MSEVLAKLEKKGGDTLLPTTPDALYINNEMATNATATLSVTKKTRWIIAVFANKDTVNSFLVGLLDVENNVGYRYGYWEGAGREGDWINWGNYITSITDTTISIKNGFGARCVTRVGAYY